MKTKTILAVAFVLTILSACMNDKNAMKDSPIYEGRKLTIGVVGKAPEVREDTIRFNKIDINEVNQGNLSSNYDAIFIMMDHSTEATEGTYETLYRNAGIPFFFIESPKTYMEDMDFDGFPYPQSGYYAAGYYRSGVDELHWDYGLYNDTVNEANILDVYSRIFTTIATMENESKLIR